MSSSSITGLFCHAGLPYSLYSNLWSCCPSLLSVSVAGLHPCVSLLHSAHYTFIYSTSKSDKPWIRRLGLLMIYKTKWFEEKENDNMIICLFPGISFILCCVLEIPNLSWRTAFRKCPGKTPAESESFWFRHIEKQIFKNYFIYLFFNYCFFLTKCKILDCGWFCFLYFIFCIQQEFSLFLLALVGQPCYIHLVSLGNTFPPLATFKIFLLTLGFSNWNRMCLVFLKS